MVFPEKEKIEEKLSVPTYNPSDEEKKNLQFLDKRVLQLKEYRSSKLLNNTRSIEDIWGDADRDFQPHELNFSKNKRLVSDDEKGLRSRFISVGEENGWQSNITTPDLYVKVNTSLSILVGQNPEATFEPFLKKYEANTEIVYGNWRHSWEVSNGKGELSKMIFNLGKYGTGVMRTYPKKIVMKKRVLKEYYAEDSKKNKYEEKDIVKYNDLCRESLNPWQVWVSDNGRPGDYLSMDDWYFEKDYSYDKFIQEFGDYANSKFVAESDLQENNEENPDEKVSNTITVGFYENQVKDIYAIWIPKVKVLLYESPLPNDDGMLSLSITQWTLRDDRCLWGIGLFEIIRNDSVLFDKLLNMTMDQVTLSIYKMFFYKSIDLIGNEGVIKLVPGKGEQVSDPASIKFLEIPGPGQDAWNGLNFIQDRKDNLSGVTPQLSAKFSGKTLGQDLQSKEAALERMRTPLDYIAAALQQEAYITVSWQKQILSTPEIIEYTDKETLILALKEFELDDQEIAAYLQEIETQNPQSEILFNGTASENGQDVTKQYANVYKQVPYNSNNLIESEEKRFYRFGVNLPIGRLDWKGIIKIKPQSVLVPSKELMRRMKLELFNIIAPLIQTMVATPDLIPFMLPPLKITVKTYDEDPKEWFDERALMEFAGQKIQEREMLKQEMLQMEKLKQVEQFAGKAQEEKQPLPAGQPMGETQIPQEPLFINK